MTAKGCFYIFVFFVMLFVIVGILGTSLFRSLSTSMLSTSSKQDQNNSPKTSAQSNAPNGLDAATPDFSRSISGKFSAVSVYNDAVTFKKSEPAKISELSLVLSILQQIEKTTWNGTENHVFPLAYKDLNKNQIEPLVQSFRSQDSSLAIPDFLEDLYLSDKAKTEITEEIFSARKEYIEFLQAKHVHQKYIDEFTTVTFPESKDRLKYSPKDDPTAPLTGVSPVNGDKRTLQFALQTIDIYLPALLIKKSGLLGDNPDEKLLRNMGLRNTAYHEFTHVLQVAVDAVNTEEGFKYPTTSITSVSPIVYAWANSATKNVFNQTATKESQADGVSFELVTNYYNLAPVQKKLYWEFLFGRLEKQRNTYDQIQSIMETKYPTYDPFDLPSKIEEDIIYKAEYSEDTKALGQMLDQIDMSSYAGYLHPLTDTTQFWEFLTYEHTP